MSLEDLKKAIVDGDSDRGSDAARALLDSDTHPREIISEGVVPAMEEVGERFDAGEYFIPEMLISADASQAVLDIVEPLLTDEDRGEETVAVFATVRGDQHDIGKNLAVMVFRGAGYRVEDLGTDVPPGDVVDAVKDTGAEVVGLSALLTTTMGEQENTIKALEEAGLRNQLKIVIGGAPITQDFADEIGADIYAESPFDGVRKLKSDL